MVGVKAVVEGGDYAAAVLVVTLVEDLLEVVLRMEANPARKRVSERS